MARENRASERERNGDEGVRRERRREKMEGSKKRGGYGKAAWV